MTTDAGPSTVDEYLAGLPADRRAAMSAVLEVVRSNLPNGYEEGILWGMIGWFVPLERFPDTYNGQPLLLAGLASQKRHLSLYLNAVYGDADEEARLRAAYAERGLRLDMGKSCIRFRAVDEVPLDVIGETIARTGVDAYLARYRAARARKGRGDPGGGNP